MRTTQGLQYNIEQFIEAKHYKTTTLRPLTSHLTSHQSKSSKANWALLARRGRTHRQHSPMDSYTWTHQSLLTGQNIHQLWADTGFRIEDLPRVMADEDEWRERVMEICAEWRHDFRSQVLLSIEKAEREAGMYLPPPLRVRMRHNVNFYAQSEFSVFLLLDRLTNQG